MDNQGAALQNPEEEEAIDVEVRPDEVAAGTVSLEDVNVDDVNVNDEAAFQAAKRKLILKKIQQDINTQKSYEVRYPALSTKLNCCPKSIKSFSKEEYFATKIKITTI